MILFVCTGNICRSAMGEVLLERYLDEHSLKIEVASAGILAWEDAPMTDKTLEVLAEIGIEGTEHTSQKLTHDLVDQAELIIAMTRDHAQGVLSRDIQARERTFLAGELLRLLKEQPIDSNKESLQHWIVELNKIRTYKFADDSILGLSSDEVIDPVSGNLEDHRVAFQIINELTQLLAKNLALIY